MATRFQELLIQAGYYFVAMMLAFLLIGILQKGFLFPYIMVRASFGRLLLVKLRAINTDYFRIGRIEDGFLVFKDGKDEKRIHIDRPSTLYRTIGGTTWVDVDAESNTIMDRDGEPLDGFDSAKFQNLYVRALTRPAIVDSKDRIVIGAILLVGILVLVAIFLVYKQGTIIEAIPGTLANLNRGAVVPG